MMYRLIRFAVLTAIPNTSAETVAKTIIDRIIIVFGPPEKLRRD